MTKKILLFIFLLSLPAFAQNVRFDAPAPSISSVTAVPFLVANVGKNSPQLSVCHSPATGQTGSTGCTNYVTTYTYNGSACPNTAQDTPNGQTQPTACQAGGDNQGNIGFWAPAGTYDYTLVINGVMYGPYTVTLGGSGSGIAGPFQVLGNASGSSASASFFNLNPSNLPFTYSGNTAKLATTTGTLVGGDCVSLDASGNFIDSGQSGCGGGGGGGNVNTNPSAGVSQTITQLPNASTHALSSFNTNIFNNIYYVPPPALAATTNGANWSQSPASPSTISTGSVTVTLPNGCPPGLLTNSGMPGGSHNFDYVKVSGSGGTEYDIITGTTCPAQGGGVAGTVTFTAVANQNAGYTLGTASGGLQEVINSSIRAARSIALADGFASIVIPPADYTASAPVSILTEYGNMTLDFSGSVITCTMSDSCLVVGDRTKSGFTIKATIKNLTFIPGVANGNFAALEDNGQAITMDGIAGFPSATAANSFGSLVTVDTDESAVIRHMETALAGSSAWAHHSTDFVSAAIKGAALSPAPVITVEDSDLQLTCQANGIDNQGGNTLSVLNTQVQAYAQFGIRGTSTFATNPAVELHNIYEEVGNCTSPTGTGESGLILNGGYVTKTGGVGPAGKFPVFASTGSTKYQYWIVIHSSTNGWSTPLYAGEADTNGAGSITVTWPQMGGGGTVTYDVIRWVATNPQQTPPIDNCPGGSTSACGSIATGVTTASCTTQGAGNTCSTTDTASANTTAYSFNGVGYAPVLTQWPGGEILSCSVEGSLTTCGAFGGPRYFPDTMSGNSGPNAPVASMGFSIPTVYTEHCDLADNTNWNFVWVHCPNDLLGATLYHLNDSSITAAVGGTKGKLNFTGINGSTFKATAAITLLDSNPNKTQAWVNSGVTTASTYRPAWDANDTMIGFDNAAGTFIPSAAQLAFGAPVSHSWYVGSTFDNSSWLERLTASAKTFKVPLTFSGTTFALNSPEVSAPATPASGTQSLYASAGNGYCSKNHAGTVFCMTAAGAATFYQTFLNSGSALPQEPSVNFTGAGVTCVDNAGATRTDCTVTGGGGATAFSSITTGSNTAQTLTVGNTSTLTFSGSGVVNANQLNGTAFSGTNGHLVSFGAANIPADSGLVAANEVNASSPGAGIAHFAGGTQTVTSSAVSLTADVTGTLPIANGGTNATTAANARIQLFPAASEVGDLVYCATWSSGCTSWALFAGNTSGTKILQETSSGVPSWVTPAAGNVTTAGMTLNRLQKSTSSTALTDSCVSDDGTTVTNNCSGGIVAGSGNPSIQTQTTSNTDLAGTGTMTGGTFTYSFLGTWASAPICVASDTAAANAVRVQTSTTTLTVTGTSGDTVNYICVGRT